MCIVISHVLLSVIVILLLKSTICRPIQSNLDRRSSAFQTFRHHDGAKKQENAKIARKEFLAINTSNFAMLDDLKNRAYEFYDDFNPNLSLETTKLSNGMPILFNPSMQDTIFGMLICFRWVGIGNPYEVTRDQIGIVTVHRSTFVSLHAAHTISSFDNLSPTTAHNVFAEDPRLFVINGDIYVIYNQVNKNVHQSRFMSMARLFRKDSFSASPASVYYFQTDFMWDLLLPGALHTEKNWVPFDCSRGRQHHDFTGAAVVAHADTAAASSASAACHVQLCFLQNILSPTTVVKARLWLPVCPLHANKIANDADSAPSNNRNSTSTRVHLEILTETDTALHYNSLNSMNNNSGNNNKFEDNSNSTVTPPPPPPPLHHHSVPASLPWRYGAVRGGSSAVRLNQSCFLAVLHSSCYITADSAKTYLMAVYLFQAVPPYSVFSISRRPIVAASFYRGSWAALHVNYIIYPGSVMLDVPGDRLVVSYGRQDREGWLVTLNLTAVLLDMI